MRIVYFLITIIYVANTNSIDGMVLFDGEQHLERLLQKSLRYQHYQKNYEKSLETGIIPKGLKIKKVPAFQPVYEDFFIKWEEILYNAEKNLVELSLYESSKVIAKIEIDFSNEIYKLHPDDYKTKRNELTNNNMLYKKQLEKRSSKKWHNLKKENKTSSKETGDKLTTTLANSSGKPNMQNQSENVHTNHTSVDKKFESTKEKYEIRSLKEAPMTVMNIRTKFITDNRKARLKKSKT